MQNQTVWIIFSSAEGRGRRGLRLVTPDCSASLAPQNWPDLIFPFEWAQRTLTSRCVALEGMDGGGDLQRPKTHWPILEFLNLWTFLMCPPRPLLCWKHTDEFYNFSSYFKQTLLQKINVKKCPSSIECWDPPMAPGLSLEFFWVFALKSNLFDAKKAKLLEKPFCSNMTYLILFSHQQCE